MYAQQSSIDPSLAALLQTAQMVTPDQTPTVAAQVAQAAAQKLMPRPQAPGIQALMPGVRQQAMNAAQAMQPVTRGEMMQMQAQGPQSTGVEGLQSNIRMAEGGIIGYAGPTDGSYVVPRTYGYAPDYEEAQKYGIVLSPYDAPEVRQEKLERLQKMREFEKERQNFGDIPTEASVARDALLQKAYADQSRARDVTGQDAARTMSPGRTMAPPAAAPAPQAPVPRPPAQRPSAPAQAAPQAGIAQLVAPTTDEAMASARAGLGLPGTGDLRAKEDAYLAALKAQPATGQQGLAALQAQQAALQGMHEKAEKESNINSAIQWLLGGKEGPGGSARASMAFSEREDARRRSYYDLQVANAAKRDAIIDLQNAREANNAKAAVEAAQRVQAADLAVAKAEGDLAAHFATSQANVYGTQVRSQDEAANRANALKVEGIRAAAREGTANLAERRFALQQLKEDGDYKAAVEIIKKLAPAAGVSTSPTIQAQYKAAIERANARAKAYGLGPEVVAQEAGVGAAQRGTRENPIKLD